jgi:flagellar hook-associated protein 2
MAAKITFTGLSTGTDWTKIVEELAKVESYTITRMETWKSTWQNKMTSIRGLNARLLSLESFVNSKNTASEFLATTATSTNENVLKVTSASTATPGAHSVTVGSSIQNKIASQGVASTSSAISSRDGTMTIYVGTSHFNVSITSGMTLSELKNAIEAADTGNLLTAQILNDGSSNKPHRLTLLANSGGSSNVISITANPTSLSFSDNFINPAVYVSGWTGTSTVTPSGLHVRGSDRTYTFTCPTIDLNGSNSAALVHWSESGGATGTLVIPENYVAGTDLYVDGLVDDVNHTTWTGTSRATSSGIYTGSLEKSYTFTVPSGTVGIGDLTVYWSEAMTGRSGTVIIPDGYTPGSALHVDGINGVVEGSGWTGTSHATSSGNHTAAANQRYIFTVQSVNGGSGTGTVGTDTIVVRWQNTDGSQSGDITLDGTYVAGTEIEVENGIKVSFSAGTLSTDLGNDFTVDVEQGPQVSFSAGDLVDGNTFTIATRTGLRVSFTSGTLNSGDQFQIDTFGNVDSVQTGTWSGANVYSAGQYLGATNKTFQFKVLNSGTLGTDQLRIQWSDTEGNSGVITIPDDYVGGTNLDVWQGLKIRFDDGDLVANETFSIDVFAPQIQRGQDSGLAQAEQVVHSGFADEDTTAITEDDAVFSFIYGGRRFSVNVDAGTTLSGLVTLINSDSSNPGVRASILNDGMGLSTSYHLVLTGMNTGAAYKITQIQDSFTGGTFTSSDFSVSQNAQNSMVKVDGYPSESGIYIQRSTNSISDVISGATLSLVGAGSATVSISADLSTIQTDLATFVNSINFVLDYIKEQTKYDSETGKAGIMLGNYSYQIVASRINHILTSNVSGLVSGVDPYTNLAQIGIKTNPDEGGKWEIDTSTLTSALMTNLDGVKKLFIKDESTGIDGIYELLSQEMEAINDSQDGPMNVLLSNYDEIISGIDEKIEREEKRIERLKEKWTEQFARLEKLLSDLNGQESYLQTLIDQLPTIGRRGQ